ncbi:MAG: hypothetical protein LBH97_01785 [Treponema sp.]|jgi:hypothetical protein|nr:hypothetical protein [Treponema sp.]
MKKMMKMLFVGAAALALLMGGCMLFEPEGPAPEYDEFGNRMVTLTIFTGDEGSRNMTLPIGRVAINYYEVVFHGAVAGDTAKYYRAAGPRGKPLTIRLPVGLNVGSTNTLLGVGNGSIAFAGTWSRETDEKKLLAVGRVTHLNYGIAGLTTNTTITAETRNIRYELVSFETRFDTSPDTSFKITGTGQSPLNVRDYETGSTPTLNSLGTSSQLNHKRDADNGDLLPYFRLPKTEPESVGGPLFPSTATTTFTFGLATTGTPPPSDLYVGIKTDIPLDFEFDSYGISTGYKEDGITAVKAVPAGGLVPPKTNIAMQGLISIAISTYEPPLNEGFCMLVISFPVKPLNTEAANPADWWTLSNGLYDYELHDNNTVSGADVMAKDSATTSFTGGPAGSGYSYGASLGGAIMLCVGDPASASVSRPIKIIITKLAAIP